MIDDEHSQSVMRNAVKIKLRNNLSIIVTYNFIMFLILTRVLLLLQQRRIEVLERF